MLNEKKACPSASRTVLPVIFEKSGLNRKDNPSDAPGNVTALISNIIINTNSNGIKTFVYFSIPFWTPAKIIQAVIAININIHKIGLMDPSRKASNIPVSSSEDFPSNALVTDWKRYSRVHPATAL